MGLAANPQAMYSMVASSRLCRMMIVAPVGYRIKGPSYNFVPPCAEAYLGPP